MDTDIENKAAKSDSSRPSGSELRMAGQNARSIIVNCHTMVRGKFRSVPLWSLVGRITGHGSGNSIEICKSANLDPHQSAGVKELRDHIPNVKAEL